MTQTQQDVELQQISPSQQDGLSATQEDLYRRQYSALISEAGQRLKVPQAAIASALVLCHKFYTKKSMLKNDRFFVAMACLFLGTKVEESPKSLRDVMRVCFTIRYENDYEKQEKMNQLEDKVASEGLKESVLLAERGILYTLGFDLNIDHPYTYLCKRLKELDMLMTENLLQTAWSFVNDSLRTTICLEYPPDLVADAALFLASQFVDTTNTQLDKQFQNYHKVKELQDITLKLSNLYIVSQKTHTIEEKDLVYKQ